jgi:nicotinate-nucleotide adenylyltransferase
MHSIAIFGGTFDPIHNGHLQTSLNIQAHFQFDAYVFLPCKIPTIKPPAFANNQHRVKMIELAIKDYPSLKIDLREIERDTPSYMVETLESFRLEFPEAAITLIIGYDSFISLTHWYQWEKLITLTNILVINRDEFAKQETPEVMQNFLKTHQSNDQNAILKHQAGTLFLFDAVHYVISSTAIREEIRLKKDVNLKLPREVYQYIKDEGLY